MRHLLLLAQFSVTSSDVSGIIGHFQNLHLGWLSTAERVGLGLFGGLLVIDWAVTAINLMLAQGTLTDWAATLTRKLLTSGAFFALLTYGPTWMQMVVDSFTGYGSMATGIGGVTAGDLAADCVDLIVTLLGGAVHSGLTLSFATALVFAFAAVIIGFSFFRLVKAFVMAKVECYLLLSVAAVQLGWGGSRFTSMYAERYVAGAIQAGLKLMSFYFIVSVERSLTPGWQAAASQLSFADSGLLAVVGLCFSVAVFGALADVDKWMAMLFSGAPQFSGHDITNSYAPAVNAASSIASFSAGMLGSKIGSAAQGIAGGFSGAANAAGASTSTGSARSASSAIINVSRASESASSRPQSQPPAPRQLPAPQRLLPPPPTNS